METKCKQIEPTNKRFRMEKDSHKFLSDVATEISPTTEDFVSTNALPCYRRKRKRMQTLNAEESENKENNNKNADNISEASIPDKGKGENRSQNQQ